MHKVNTEWKPQKWRESLRLFINNSDNNKFLFFLQSHFYASLFWPFQYLDNSIWVTDLMVYGWYLLCWKLVFRISLQKALSVLLVGIKTHALLHNSKRQISGFVLSGILAEMQKSEDIKSARAHTHTHQHLHQESKSFFILELIHLRNIEPVFSEGRR